MLHAQARERELIAQFLAELRSLPEVRAELERVGSPKLDAQLALDVAGKPVHALVELRKAVYPRDARQLVWRIRDLGRQQPAGESGGEALPVLIAESISPGAKELLRAERVGYYDSGGSLYLPARGAYLYVDRPPPKSLSRSMRSLFTGRRAQVLHGLLVRRQDWFGVKDLAEALHLAVGLHHGHEVASQRRGPERAQLLRPGIQQRRGFPKVPLLAGALPARLQPVEALHLREHLGRRGGARGGRRGP